VVSLQQERDEVRGRLSCASKRIGQLHKGEAALIARAEAAEKRTEELLQQLEHVTIPPVLSNEQLAALIQALNNSPEITDHVEEIKKFVIDVNDRYGMLEERLHDAQESLKQKQRFEEESVDSITVFWKEQYDELKKKYSDIVGEVEEMEPQLQKAKEENILLQAQLAHVLHETDHMNDDDDDEDGANGVKLTFDNVQELLERNSSLHSEISRLRQALAVQEVVRTNTTVDAALSELKVLQEEHSQFVINLKKVKDERDKLKQELDDCKREGSSSGQNVVSRDVYNALKKQMEDMQSEAERVLNERVSALTKQIQELTEAKARAEADNEHHADDSAMTDECESKMLEQQRELLAAKEATRAEEVEQWKKQFNESQEELETVRGQLKAAQTDLSAALERQKQLLEERTALKVKGDLSRILGQFSDDQKEQMTADQQTIVSLKEQLTEATSRIHQMLQQESIVRANAQQVTTDVYAERNTLQSKVAALEAKVNEEEMRYASLKGKEMAAVKELEKYKEQYQRLSQENQRLLALGPAELRLQVDLAKSESRSLQEQLNTERGYSETYKALSTSAHEEYLAAIHSYDEFKKKAEEELSQARSDADGARAELENYMALYKSEKEDLDHRESVCSESQRQADETVRVINEKLAENQKLLEAEKESGRKLSVQLETALGKLSDTSNALSGAKSELATFKQQNCVLETRTKELGTELDQTKQFLNQSQTELQQSKEQCKAQGAHIVELDEELTSLRKQYEAALSQIELAAMRAQVSEKQLLELSSCVVSSNGTAASQSRVQPFTVEHEKLAEMESLLSAVRSDKHKIECQMLVHQRDATELRQQVGSLEAQLEQKIASLQDMSERYEGVPEKSQFLQIQQEFAQCKESLAQLTSVKQKCDELTQLLQNEKALHEKDKALLQELQQASANYAREKAKLEQDAKSASDQLEVSGSKVAELERTVNELNDKIARQQLALKTENDRVLQGRQAYEELKKEKQKVNKILLKIIQGANATLTAEQCRDIYIPANYIKVREGGAAPSSSSAAAAVKDSDINPPSPVLQQPVDSTPSAAASSTSPAPIPTPVPAVSPASIASVSPVPSLQTPTEQPQNEEKEKEGVSTNMPETDDKPKGMKRQHEEDDAESHDESSTTNTKEQQSSSNDAPSFGVSFHMPTESSSNSGSSTFKFGSSPFSFGGNPFGSSSLSFGNNPFSFLANDERFKPDPKKRRVDEETPVQDDSNGGMNDEQEKEDSAQSDDNNDRKDDEDNGSEDDNNDEDDDDEDNDEDDHDDGDDDNGDEDDDDNGDEDEDDGGDGDDGDDNGGYNEENDYGSDIVFGSVSQ